MKNFPLIAMLFLAYGCSAPKKSTTPKTKIEYRYEVDLFDYVDDQLEINLLVSNLKEQTATFCLPKIVPGIYGAMNFGQYITNFQVYDESGSTLPVNRLDENCWEILKAHKLHCISYDVDDVWEAFDFSLEQGFYRSAGTSFQEHAFVLNNNCLFGYFRGFENSPFQINISSHLYGATSLKKLNNKSRPETDVFLVEDYHELVDHPILYSVPDTAIINLPNIEIEVACFSTSGEPIAQAIAQYIKPLLENQSKYLNGKLPVSKYTFLIYHNAPENSGGFSGDGLEHSNSTLILYCMPMDLDVIKASTYRIASHEFFHILMPLGLHAHEIANYDFNEPKFSRHLWLYEGMTEYFTIHMPIKTGAQSLEGFIWTIEEKIKEMQSFDNSLPLTQLSLQAMDLQDQYYNVYLKGALLNLCLDIKLRSLSNGSYGVQEMIADLIQQYGPDRPFPDEQLFDIIVQTTGFPELKSFIQKYIEGSEELPLKNLLEQVGMEVDLAAGKIRLFDTPTDAQLNLRRYWIGQ